MIVSNKESQPERGTVLGMMLHRVRRMMLCRPWTYPLRTSSKIFPVLKNATHTFEVLPTCPCGWSPFIGLTMGETAASKVISLHLYVPRDNIVICRSKDGCFQINPSWPNNESGMAFLSNGHLKMIYQQIAIEAL